MIIDCHGHFTTTPAAHDIFRKAQLEWAAAPNGPMPVAPRDISDEQLRDSVEPNQLRLMAERGADLILFSPKASAMEHHRPDAEIALAWARASNDLIARVVGLYPDRFAGVCQLPQTPAGTLANSLLELRRCVDELGFVGCNLNPDPSGGSWSGPPLTDRSWYPLYEVLCELDVPAMIHVSSSVAAAVPTLGAHYLNADTTVFMQLVEGDLFADFPTLRLVIPHGGGAVPFHWGRYRGLADRLGRPPLSEHVMGNVFFDTCVYHQAGVDTLLRVIGAENILFGSEMIGAVRGVDPETGHYWDDTKRYLDAAALDARARKLIYQENALRVYPRLAVRLNS